MTQTRTGQSFTGTDYQRLARELVDPDVWDFIEGGAEAERTVAANLAAFDRVRLRPRVLAGVSEVDTSVELFGTRYATPLGVAPTAYHRLVDAEGEVATARGAGAAGALFVVGMFASRTLEEIAEASSSELWIQLYWLRRRDVMAALLRRAERCGYGAVMLTVDVPRMGRRWRDMRNGFAIGGDVAAVNIDAGVMASAHERAAGGSALVRHTAQQFDAGVTWDDLAWLRAQTRLPLVLKGILTAEDARLAVRHGADAIVVSNHGGRQLDGAVASLDVLAEVADAAGGRPVLFDGGVRRGVDALAALALGARMVLLGRPPLWGLAAGGADGVAGLLRTTTEELAHAMALAGRPTLGDLDRSVVRMSTIAGGA
ncbi:alpha-hydroxy acid oxidase [Dactylosporangium sucinum]|uniref:Alpha-hydroxy-acid oxidizing enzyme n=1 Tax=Dactylosporangium sucinum TaxID=1424081 RepID=A0A917WJH8_9ACTN|nr:alpha-hydroxy acid oxidase [Dactylosporangium sucinum]GGM09678.1 alpha-hydroxy-acid oxidizing enzyme [Dactylosporangium sucinum]